MFCFLKRLNHVLLLKNKLQNVIFCSEDKSHMTYFGKNICIIYDYIDLTYEYLYIFKWFLSILSEQYSEF